MATPHPLIAGNWKMNGLGPDLAQARAVADALAETPAAARVALHPPATLIERMARALGGTGVQVGAQDVHGDADGAHTGDLAAAMLVDAGATLVIVGHSERRAAHGETDAMVAAKALAAARAGLEPIVCVGESREEHAAGRTLEVIRAQVAGSIPADLGDAPFCLAYEPIWAIGSGRQPGLDEIARAHAALREAVVSAVGEAGRRAPILFGGSVNASNAAAVLGVDEVGGALVGGASLRAVDFLPIVRAARA